jgi:putative FmdB family regulatory protein
MPTYEYQCRKGHIFERIQSIREAPIERCLVDNANGRCRASCKRLISISSFVLKGDGWAKDGYGYGRPDGKGKKIKADKQSPERPKENGEL